jgi:hypothetical protein
VLLLLALTFPSCARISPHLDYAPERGLQQVHPPSADSAVIIIVRPDDIYTRYVTASVLDGDRFLTLLTQLTHFVYVTKPGVHHLMAHVSSPRPSYIDAELAPGKIYFAVIKWQDKGEMELIPITPNDEYWVQVPQWLSKSKAVQPNASAFAWFEAHRAELLQEQGARKSDSTSHQLLASDGVDRIP